MDGCLTEELFKIGKRLCKYGDFTEKVKCTDCDVEKLKERYNTGDEEVITYMDNIRRWLLKQPYKSLYDDWSLYWYILEFECAVGLQPSELVSEHQNQM